MVAALGVSPSSSHVSAWMTEKQGNHIAPLFAEEAWEQFVVFMRDRERVRRRFSKEFNHAACVVPDSRARSAKPRSSLGPALDLCNK